MSDSYQAIYDAVRSRISGGDVGSAVESAVREAFSNAAHHLACTAENFAATAFEQQRPSAIFRPGLTIDGDQWCALYGADLQSCVAGFGDTPALAMQDFDTQWLNSKAGPQPKETTHG